MRLIRSLMLAAALGLCHIPIAAADDDPAQTSFGSELGIAFGGDNVLDPAISHGADQTYRLGAGDDVYYGLRLTQDIWHTPLAVQVAAAYGSGGEASLFCYYESAGNGCSYSLQHATYWLKLRYHLNDTWTLGAGRVFHRNIILESAATNNAFPNVDFRPARGWMMELEVRQDIVFAGLRYTHMMYHPVDTGASVDASSIGIYVGFEGPMF